jgi:hypothetical protein
MSTRARGRIISGGRITIKKAMAQLGAVEGDYWEGEVIGDKLLLKFWVSKSSGEASKSE